MFKTFREINLWSQIISLADFTEYLREQDEYYVMLHDLKKIEEKTPPKTFYKIIISLLPTPKKGNGENYRPVSHMNID